MRRESPSSPSLNTQNYTKETAPAHWYTHMFANEHLNDQKPFLNQQYKLADSLGNEISKNTPIPFWNCFNHGGVHTNP